MLLLGTSRAATHTHTHTPISQYCTLLSQLRSKHMHRPFIYKASHSGMHVTRVFASALLGYPTTVHVHQFLVLTLSLANLFSNPTATSLPVSSSRLLSFGLYSPASGLFFSQCTVHTAAKVIFFNENI